MIKNIEENIACVSDKLINWRVNNGISEQYVLTGSELNQLISFTYDCITDITNQSQKVYMYRSDMPAVKLINNDDFKIALKKAIGSKEVADIVTAGHYSYQGDKWVRTSDYAHGAYQPLTDYVSEKIEAIWENGQVIKPLGYRIQQYFLQQYRRFFREKRR